MRTSSKTSSTNSNYRSQTKKRQRFGYPVTDSDYYLHNYKMWTRNIDNNIAIGMIMYTKAGLACQEVRHPVPGKHLGRNTVSLESNDKILTGCMIYRSYSGTTANSNHLLECLQKAITKIFTKTIIMGDFNYPNINWENLTTISNINSNAYKLIECLRDCYMYQLINKPSQV